MVEVDNDRLTQLIELCKQEYPDIDPFIIWVYSMDYLLNEQGIYGSRSHGPCIRRSVDTEITFNLRRPPRPEIGSASPCEHGPPTKPRR